MKYQAPYGVSDPNAPYINGNPAAGIQGSIPPAAAFEQPMREMDNLIRANGMTPNDADLYQMAKSLQLQAVCYAIDQSTAANALICTFNPPLVAYGQGGLVARVKVAHTNTGAVTFNGGAGSVNVIRPGGAALIADDLLAGGVATLVYDGTAFQLVNFQAASGSGGAVNNFVTDIPYAVDTSGAPNAIVANYAPAITSIVEGKFIACRVANGNTGAVLIQVNALGPVPIKSQRGFDLRPGDLVVGGIILLCYRGSYYQLMSSGGSWGARPTIQFGVPPAGGQFVPPATPVLVNSMTYVYEDNCVTTTWDGVNLRIGAGEDGLWAFRYYLTYGNATPANRQAYCFAMRVRAGASLCFMEGYSITANPADLPPFASGSVQCQAGDVINFWTGYWPTGGGSLVPSTFTGMAQPIYSPNVIGYQVTP